MTPELILKKYYGYNSFRDKQEAIIQHVLNKQDAVVVMPTGGGKSVCFQIPAMLLPGITIVVSPLIALMKDQVDGLNAIGIPAIALNSSMNAVEQQEAYKRINNGEIKWIKSNLARRYSFIYENQKKEIIVFTTNGIFKIVNNKYDQEIPYYTFCHDHYIGFSTDKNCQQTHI